jgi:hypothetical protein
MKNKIELYAVISVILIVLSYSVLFLVSDEMVVSLTAEDGVFETTGAAFFLLASLCFFVIFFKNRKSTGLMLKKSAFLLLACAFLFAFLEEISYGQRIFNISTPQAIQDVNMQNEINIHNLKIFHGKTITGERKGTLALFLNFDRIFSFFWFSFCCLLPFLYKFNSEARDFLNKKQFPIVPLSLGLIFFLNYSLAELVSPSMNPILLNPHIEIKETNFAFLFFIVSIFLLKNDMQNRQ